MLLAGSGLAAFCHSVLYGRPTIARAGMTLVLVGFGVTLALLLLAWLRVAFPGDDGLGLIVVVTAAAVLIIALTYATSGHRPGRRKA